jgi:type IV secretion system protein VirD4
MTQPAKTPIWAKAALLAAVILAVAGVWLYLSGAIFFQLAGKKFEDAKFLTFYQYWYHYSDILLIRKKLFTAGGLAFAVLLIPVAIILKPTPKSLHGNARFAKKLEIEQAGLMGEAGLIVGQVGKKFLMFAGALHAILCAPTRSGKGVSTVIPNCLNWRDSLVVLDTKQEAFDFTSGYRAKYGQECFLFNPSPKDYRTHRWNPLSYISDDPNFRINDIQKIASFLFPDIEGADPIWSSSGRSLFLGTVLYLIETPGKTVTLGEVLRTVTQQEEAGKFFARTIQERQEEGTPLSPTCAAALSDFISTSDNTRTSIRKTFSSRFELLFNPLIDAAMSGNDFDLRDLRKKRMSIYVGVTPDDLERMGPLLNLFFQQLIDLNTQELPLKNPALKYPCLLLLDEFTAAGRIPALSKGVSYVAGYGLKLLLIIQSYSQLREKYGDDAAETFSTNLGVQIDFAPAPQDQERSEAISKALGDQTWRVKSWGKTFGQKGSRSENKSDQRRPLMLPQEVKQIGMWKQFIFMENVLPIFCEKIGYYKEKVFLDRLKEVSPSLAKLGEAIPTKDQLEMAAGTGELRADVPLIAVGVTQYSYVPAPQPALVVTETERVLSEQDAENINDLAAADFSCDFSDIEIPSEQPTDEEMQAATDELLARFGMTA